MKFLDFLTVVFVWGVAGAIIYITKSSDWIVIIVCIAAAYYLSKWVILKRQKEPDEPKDLEPEE